MTPSIIVRFDFSAPQSIFWQVLTLEAENLHFQADLAGFKDWLQQQAEQWNLYLLLPNQQFSFHHLEIPAAVKRSAHQLAPVLMEEQLAEDIDRVFVHYVASDHRSADGAEHHQTVVVDPILNNTETPLSNSTSPEVNVLACNRSWFEQLITCFKNENTRLKACLPESVCGRLPPIQTQLNTPYLLADLPTIPLAAQLPFPAKLQLSSPETQQLLHGLKHSEWNLVSPEQSSSSPLHLLLLITLVCAGLYLLNIGAS